MHIMSDDQYNRYLRYQALGKTPEELQRMIDYAEDPAPLPMDDEKDYSGLLEE